MKLNCGVFVRKTWVAIADDSDTRYWRHNIIMYPAIMSITSLSRQDRSQDNGITGEGIVIALMLFELFMGIFTPTHMKPNHE